MKWGWQLRLDLGLGRQMRPASLKEKATLVSQPASPVQPPRETIKPELLINGFLFTCAKRGIVGPRDLKHLKTLCDAYAQSENVYSLEQWDLGRELALRGIAHQQRELQPYETGYEMAVLESGSQRPQVTFFVMPAAYPIQPRDSQIKDRGHETFCDRQVDLFSETPEMYRSKKNQSS